MLELKNITKTYKPKKGVPVEALRGIDLEIEDKGMVFILGKSGSGKSTLLNIIGGLDSADSGEIIIEGKSTKGFKEKDYDNYRNTYIGFVFQEYNILNEFSVGENISLAIELQNEKKNKERVEEILKEVGLEGYGERKPNELSGGQKQRVAIARALIKEPKIILADEPTGALDSETGKSIFELLKKLSEDKLVIVVSHDREYAEEYGDRIIELNDGKICSDKCINKFESISCESNANIKESAKNTHLPFLRAFRMGAQSIKTKPVRLIITILLCLVSFAFFGLADTVAAYDKNQTAINSIIDQQYDTLAVTSGYGALSSDISDLKDKTGLDFLGVATYQGISQKLNVTYPSKVKGENGKSVYYNLSLNGYLPAEKVIDGKEYKLIAGKMPEKENDIVVSKYVYEQFALGGITLSDGYQNKYIEPEEINTLENFVEKAYLQFSDDDSNQLIWKVVGVVDTLEDKEKRYSSLKPSAHIAMPKEKYNILASECENYFYYSYHALGFVTQSTYNNIVDFNKNKYKGKAANGSIEFKIQKENNSIYKFSGRFYNVLNESYIDDLKIVWSNDAKKVLKENEFIIGINFLTQIGTYFDENKKINIQKQYFDGLINFSQLATTFNQLKEYVGLYVGVCEEAEKIEDAKLDEFKKFIDSVGDGQDEENKKMLRALAINQCFQNIQPFISSGFSLDYYAQQFTDLQWRIIYAGYLMTEKFDFYEIIPSLDGGYYKNITAKLSGEEIREQYGNLIYIEYLVKEINDISFDSFSVDFDYDFDMSEELKLSPQIVGVYLYEENKEDVYIINNTLYSLAENAIKPEYAFLITDMPENKDSISTIVDMHFNNAEKSFTMHNAVVSAIALEDATFMKLGQIFLYIGIGLAVFSIMLMSNYIAVSISSQTKEIGIIRAIGATKSDVFKIYYSECFIISMINFVLSAIVAGIVSVFLNISIAKDSGFELVFINFGIRQILLLFALSIFTGLIACLICTYSIAKRKPVDCISEKQST